ncbi:MAG TPA: RsmE family RNA methyltransferase [Tepidisphaeraceae bacterium]|nr:RsmE family RNA methyltransferase [Tepidisphaeraceae bacterium]
MARRIYLAQTLSAGGIELDSRQAHHVRDVLRLKTGDTVEVFDDAGHSASATIETCDANRVCVQVKQVQEVSESRQIIVASAVPKGNRADWMIEKLSELGVSRFIPLETSRSVVLPAGKGKYDRWRRIATESAKQSRRSGVMQIDELISLDKLLASSEVKGVYLSTEPDARSISSFIPHPSSFLLIGPEGGWTDGETSLMKSSGLTAAKLTGTILRVETAAVLAAGIVLSAPNK